MNRSLRVLVGCEFTGTVRRAFTARGHDAWGMANALADQWGGYAEMLEAAE